VLYLQLKGGLDRRVITTEYNTCDIEYTGTNYFVIY